MTDEGKPQYRNFDEEAKLQMAEVCGIADVITHGQPSSLSSSALGIVNDEQAVANITELVTRA